jgi:hypothetical protein
VRRTTATFLVSLTTDPAKLHYVRNVKRVQFSVRCVKPTYELHVRLTLTLYPAC